MDTYIDQIQQILSQGETPDLKSFLNLIYFRCEKRGDPDGEIQRTTKELEKYVADLDFPIADPVLSAVNALCAEYDYAAFTEGFQTGASLILSLLQRESRSVLGRNT